MNTKIVLGIFFVMILILMMPSISSIQLISADKTNESIVYSKTDFYRYLDNLPNEIPPKWFIFFYTIIMLSLNFRIEFLTPLAITPTGEYWGSFEINSYFFFIILLTLVYRFRFWYNFFDKILEKNNWELP